VIGAVVHKEPDLDELSSRVPGRIRRLLERCLEKDVNRRLQSIGEARIALQEWLETRRRTLSRSRPRPHRGGGGCRGSRPPRAF
jgi:hypothetical protein